MVPDAGDRGRDRDGYEDYGAVWRGLRRLSYEILAPGHTASQTQRGALNKEHVDWDQIADSAKKVMVSDVVAILLQTREEHKQGVGRFYVGKNRCGTAKREWKVRLDWAKIDIRTIGCGAQTRWHRRRTSRPQVTATVCRFRGRSTRRSYRSTTASPWRRETASAPSSASRTSASPARRRRGASWSWTRAPVTWSASPGSRRCSSTCCDPSTRSRRWRTSPSSGTGGSSARRTSSRPTRTCGPPSLRRSRSCSGRGACG